MNELEDSSIEVLLNTVMSLTHRIHAYERELGNGRGSATDDRAARDMVTAEIIRRTEVRVNA